MDSLVKDVLARLNPGSWPFRINDLPDGSALVGGAIRDALIGRSAPRLDLDFVVPNNAIQITQMLAEKLQGSCVVLDQKRDIARLVLREWTIDFACQCGETLELDLLRRDFRLNAIGIDCVGEHKIHDPTNGIADIKHKRLVAVSEENLIQDPLRLLRGIRLLAELGFSLDDQTSFFLHANSHLLDQAAPERIQSELNRLVLAPWVEQVFPLLSQIGLLKPWQNKEDYIQSHSKELIYAKTFSSSEISMALPLVRLTRLLSDKGLKQLRFSRSFREKCSLLRKWQQRNDGQAFNTLSEADRFQLHKDLEDCLPALIVTFPLSQQIGWLERWRNSNDPLFHPSYPIDGNTLKASLGLASGPALGKLLDFLSKERAFGRLSKKEEILDFALIWIQQNKTLL